tara:strand:- start:2870 stop:3067 length:198 start_codon:yes stop_codon:yes gene_type:complete
LLKNLINGCWVTETHIPALGELQFAWNVGTVGKLMGDANKCCIDYFSNNYMNTSINLGSHANFLI